jgi:hypothetical protein
MADTNTRSGSSAWDGRAQHGATGAGDVDNDGTPVNDDGTPVDDARVDAAASGAAASESSTNETAGVGTAQAGTAQAGNAGADTTGTETAGTETPGVDTSADGADLGPAQVRTSSVTETDPLLVHVGESIEEAKEAAREVFGEHGSGSEDEVDPNLGTNAPVP